MKKLIIPIVCLLFVGCNTKNIDGMNVILREHKLSGCNCQFDLYGNSSPNDIGNREKNAVYFIDSCSKFDIGDTVKIIINKIHQP